MMTHTILISTLHLFLWSWHSFLRIPLFVLKFHTALLDLSSENIQLKYLQDVACTGLVKRYQRYIYRLNKWYFLNKIPKDKIQTWKASIDMSMQVTRFTFYVNNTMSNVEFLLVTLLISHRISSQALISLARIHL